MKAHDNGHLIEYLPASHPNGKTVLVLRARDDRSKSVRYTITFTTAP